MAYLNGNCTFLKPSLEIENTIIEGDERATATEFLSLTLGEIDFFADEGKVYICVWDELPNIPIGTEIKSVDVHFGNDILTAAQISELYDGYEWVDKKVRFVEYVGSITLYSLYLGVTNELYKKFQAGVASGIDITYYTE